VLLLDEPFGALDEVTRADMQQLLLQLIATHNTAAVLITHDIDEALLLSDRICYWATTRRASSANGTSTCRNRARAGRGTGRAAHRHPQNPSAGKPHSRTTPSPLPSEAVHVHG
jgi:NitT/TauT family transport system ATP-binding protein